MRTAHLAMQPPETTPSAADGAVPDRAGDRALVAALRDGDEQAFAAFVERHHASLVHLAEAFVPSRAIAEEVAQECWLGFLEGLDRFEGRSSLRTWLFRILTNRAKTRGKRERRTVAFTDLAIRGAAAPAVAPERFQSEGDPAPGHWAAPPRAWNHPEERLLGEEVRDLIGTAIAALPPAQQRVITLRDVEGWAPEEVCRTLEISDANQRVLLHRARSRVRGALESYFDPDLGVAAVRVGGITRLLRRRDRGAREPDRSPTLP